jgi:hypothetical protein
VGACQAGIFFIFAGTAVAYSLAGVTFREKRDEMGLNRPVPFGDPAQKTYIHETMGSGVAIADFDGDGANDLLFAAQGAPRFYRNRGDGTFEEVAEKWRLTDGGWQQGVCVGDLDNDGRVDLLITRLGENLLYRNRGGFFEQVKLPGESSRWGAGCALTDYDRDGRLDIFVSNYVDLDLAKTPKPGANENCLWRGVPVVCGPKGLPPARNLLYRNLGDWKFEDVSHRAGILKPGGRYGLGVVAADFNNDGWPDIYVACDQTPSLLYQNNRDGTFRERGAEAGVAYNFDGQLQAGMGVAVADYDGNGFLDIAKTNFSGDLPSLYLNEDGEFFRDASREAGLGVRQLLGWGAAFVDVDEDGWPDLIMANGHVYPEVDGMKSGETYRQLTLLYRNLGNGRFADITSSAGPPFRELRPSRGLALGDLDGDGRPEIVITNMSEAPSVLKNISPRGNWIRIELQGTKSNRDAIGARVTVEAGGRKQTNEVRAGGSYYSQHELALYFGLGAAKQVDRIEVTWPSGWTQSLEQLDPNRTVRLVEPSGR